MHQFEAKPFVQWWQTPKFPLIHLRDKTSLIKIWFFHPIKRRLAYYYLRFLKKFTNIKVIGITGSAGKTTTKEMAASVLQKAGKTVYTKENIDPIYNIPSTILKTPPGTDYLILEMGIEYPNEMDFYIWLAKPDIGIITNIFPTHLEFLGNLSGVFKEKSKLVYNLDKKDYAILNANDPEILKLKGKLGCKVIWFGDGTNVMSSKEKLVSNNFVNFDLILDQKSKSKLNITIPTPGLQFVQNALAATACAKALNIQTSLIKDGLECFMPPKHRMKVFKTSSGSTIIDDSYNNNPMAAISALNNFERFGDSDKRIIVFGDMLELGKWEYKYHKDIAERISKMKHIYKVICVGVAVRTTYEALKKKKYNVVLVQDYNSAYDELRSHLAKKTLVLIKGSRSVGLDKLVARLS